MRPRFVGGAMLAALSAGPCFVLIMLAQFGLGTSFGRMSPDEVLPILLVAIPFGFVIACLPSIGAAAGLARWGELAPRARHPLVWAAAGFVVGFAIGLAILSLSGPPAAAMLLGAGSFGLAGLACALLARWRTRWINTPSPRP